MKDSHLKVGQMIFKIKNGEGYCSDGILRKNLDQQDLLEKVTDKGAFMYYLIDL